MRSAASSEFSDMSQTPRTTAACFTASLVGGLFAAIVAALLWPVFLWISNGELSSPTWAPHNILLLLLLVAAFAGVTAIFFGILIGFPTLIILEKNKFNRPWVTGIIGALFAAAGFFAIWAQRSDWTALAYWKPLAYLVLIGAAQGVCSSFFLQKKR